MLSLKTRTLPFWQNYKLGAFLLLVLLSLFAYSTGLFVMPSTNAADDPEPIPGNSVSGPSTLSVSIADSIILDLTPISSNGTFATTSTTDTNISVSTNHFTGYTLTMSANELGTNALVNDILDDDDNIVTSYSIPSVTSSVSEEDYKDDTYASEHDLNNTYGFRPSTLYNTTTGTIESNNNYLPIPNNDDIEDIIIAKTTTANNIDSSTGNLTVDNYNIAVGSRVDTTTVTGEYKNTFIITAVTNPTPYTIAYDKNTDDTRVSNMPGATSGSTIGNTIQISSDEPTRANYTFKGWCTTPVQDGTTCDAPNTQYNAGSTYELDQTASNSNITLYAIWNPTITFIAGSGIETVIVADSSENFKPYYATAGNNIAFENPTPGNEFIVTVVPEPNYVLDYWLQTIPSYGTTNGDFTDKTKLTTNFFAGNTGETLTANGISGSYISMQSFSACTAEGNNVTDIRDGKSYTVAKLGDYCYMLSNLRLAGSTSTNTVTLDSTTSNIEEGTTFTMPDQTDPAESAEEPKMYFVGNEYYYNYRASISLLSGSEVAIENFYSICPTGWNLPAYIEKYKPYPGSDYIYYSYFINPIQIWGNGTNPGMLITSGNYGGNGKKANIGFRGRWWSRVYGKNLLYDTDGGSTIIKGDGWYLDKEQSVRCITNYTN